MDTGEEIWGEFVMEYGKVGEDQCNRRDGCSVVAFERGGGKCRW